jgi:serpin B
MIRLRWVVACAADPPEDDVVMRSTLALCAVLAASCATTFDASSPDGAVKASNRFGFDLYARVKQGGGNIICSPISASIALTMTAAGAGGKTLAQMANVLHLDPGRLPESHAAFASLLTALNQRETEPAGLQLQVADRLWGQKGVSFKREFVTLLERRYRAPLAEVDFVSATEAARDAINRWAAERTHDRIPQIIPPGALSPDSRLVLTNAVYFKGAWFYPFEPSATADLPFSTPAGPRVARMMARTADVRHTAVRGAALVELPYKGGLSMVVILPDAVDGLDDVESRLASYPEWIAALRPKRVDLQLPRWRVTSDLALKETLVAMGMPAAFEVGADFGGIADVKPLYVHDVLQQAFIDVDETGTEAAAVTAVVAGTKKGRVEPELERVVFHANRPFLYVIRDVETGAALFVGRVVEVGG